MIFANPQYFLFGLILLPVVAVFLFWASKRRGQLLGKLGEKKLIDRLNDNLNTLGRRWRTALRFAALFLLVIALSRPQWGSEVREIEQEGLQVMVALDVSQSMLAEDIKPTRLDRAKLEIADLTERLDGDEVGLVLFSGASFIQVPLTSDYMTALSYLDSAGPQVISRPGTVIGDAIRTAMSGFDPDLSSQKVLVVMTDGEDAETDPVSAAQEAADADILIYTIGFGTPEGEPIPETNQYGDVIGYKRDAQGNAILSWLDETTLQNVALTGNGKYYQASADGAELDSLLSEIDQLQKAQLESRFETTQIDRFQIFLALAVIAMVLGELIPDRKSKQTVPTWKSLAARFRRPESLVRAETTVESTAH